MQKFKRVCMHYIYGVLVATAAIALLACSPVEFEHDPACGAFGNQQCLVTPLGLRHFDNTIEVGNGKVDILFVDDNSGSMSVEQRKMGEKFPTFIDALEDLDYQIAIITTDVAGDGPLQNGRFIPFANGELFLTKAMDGVSSLFLSNIMRPETIECDSSGFKSDSCPSADERGIFAANRAIVRQEQDFFRNGAHLAIVILSDEDERSDSGEIPGFGLEIEDTPPELLRVVEEALGEDKTLGVHAIVIRPGDTQCLSEQVSQANVRGFFGAVYADLAEMTKGTVGSICADDYGAELGNIGENILSQVNSVELACEPVDEVVTVIVTPEPANFETLVDVEHQRVWFNQNLAPGTTARVVYDCQLEEP